MDHLDANLKITSNTTGHFLAAGTEVYLAFLYTVNAFNIIPVTAYLN